ncbi:uncharacterized protein PRCAT00002530001 [Priceomyces carsonii]|uniref:uncharacterized protein n=1 Tax=Priceomyces carsonii TaxID=28549 RepID=UPI002ED8493D|nr:unnamed protein product [Priceomyces carsonii]
MLGPGIREGSRICLFIRFAGKCICFDVRLNNLRYYLFNYAGTTGLLQRCVIPFNDLFVVSGTSGDSDRSPKGKKEKRRSNG